MPNGDDISLRAYQDYHVVQCQDMKVNVNSFKTMVTKTQTQYTSDVKVITTNHLETSASAQDCVVLQYA